MSAAYKLPTLLEFWTSPFPRNSDVKARGFRRLYVRKGPLFLCIPPSSVGELVANLLQLASLEATRPGHGAFTTLLAHIDEHLGCNIYVENVLNPRFATHLPRAGFAPVLRGGSSSDPPCFLRLRRA